MIVVRIELHSAITGLITEIGRMTLTNRGDGTETIADYNVAVYRKPAFAGVTRTAEVLGHRRKATPVWHLVARALANAGYLTMTKPGEHS